MAAVPKTSTAAAAAAPVAEVAAKVDTSRRMHFPYTSAAKLAQFPLKFHLQNSPIWKWYAIGLVLSMPVFWKIQTLARSPENCKKWDEIHAKAAIPHHPWDD